MTNVYHHAITSSTSVHTTRAWCKQTTVVTYESVMQLMTHILGVSPLLCLNMWSCKSISFIIDQWVTEIDSQTPAWSITDLMGRTLKISNKWFIMFMFDSATPAVHIKSMCISIHPCMFWVFVSGSCCSSFTRLEGQSDKDLPFSSRSGSSAYCLRSAALILTCVLPYRLGLKWTIDFQWDFQWRDKNSDLNEWICLNVNSKCLYTQ